MDSNIKQALEVAAGNRHVLSVGLVMHGSHLFLYCSDQVSEHVDVKHSLWLIGLCLGYIKVSDFCSFPPKYVAPPQTHTHTCNFQLKCSEILHH